MDNGPLLVIRYSLVRLTIPVRTIGHVLVLICLSKFHRPLLCSSVLLSCVTKSFARPKSNCCSALHHKFCFWFSPCQLERSQGITSSYLLPAPLHIIRQLPISQQPRKRKQSRVRKVHMCILYACWNVCTVIHKSI